VKKKWKKLSRKKCIIAGGVVILLVVAVTFTAGSRKKGSMAAETAGEIISVEVTKGTIETGVSGTGTLAYGDSTVVTVPEDLEIDEVYVSVGSSVTAGTLLATVNQASLASCLSEVQDAISDLDSTISTQKSKSESTTISAGVAGRVKAIYATEDASVPEVMKEYGALMLISTDGYMAVDLTDATGLSVGDEVTVSSGDTEVSATVESIDGENAVIIFADSKFDIDEELTVTDSDEKSLGTAKAYVHAPLQVVGTNGTVSAIKVSLDSSVSASSTVITLEDTAQTVEYQQAVQERADMVELLNTLISIQTEGGITAKEDGIVEAINADGSTTGTSSSGGMVVGSTSQATTVAEDSSNSASEDTEEESVETVLTEADSSATTDTVAKVSTSATASTSNTTTGGLMTMSTAAFSTTSEDQTATQTTTASIKASAATQNADSKTPLEAPTGLTAGKGVISGTTTDMEYAASEDAEEWTQCTDKTTTVETGTWYVRYKETQVNAASTAVKVEVTEKADTENSVSNNQNSNLGNQNSTDNSTSETQNSTDNGTSENAANSQNVTENSAVLTQSGNAKSGTASSAQTASAQTTASAKSGSGSSSSASTSSSTTEDSDALATTDVFTIASGDTMTVTMTVDELDILSMEEGQDAVVTVDAVEDQTFNGSITSVNGSASSSGGVAQYSVEVTFEKTADMLAGMSASVEVVLEKAEDVLVVPISAVTDQGRNSVVYTGNSDGTLSDEVEIETGLSDETYVEVVSGLSEGDTIYYQMQGSEDSSSTDQMGGFGGGMPDGDMPSDMNGGKDFDGGKSGGGDMKGMGGGDGNRGGQQ
jgi:hypothetical protein